MPSFTVWTVVHDKHGTAIGLYSPLPDDAYSMRVRRSDGMLKVVRRSAGGTDARLAKLVLQEPDDWREFED